MSGLDVIECIGVLFALCGISSLRNFLPTFVFLLIAATLPRYSHCPDLINQLAQSVPPPILSGWSLVLFGTLAMVELYANWNDTAREMLSDMNWEKYFKPMFAFLFALVIGSPETAAAVSSAVPGTIIDAQTVAAVTSQANVLASQASAVATQVSSTVSADSVSWTAWLKDIFLAGMSALGTSILCNIKGKIYEILYSIDPDNSFKLHTLAAMIEESSWFLLLIVALVIPGLAIILVLVMAGCAVALRKLLAKIERDRSHPCPSCGKLVHDSAVICSSCRVEQPMPYHEVALMGFAGKGFVDRDSPGAVLAHHRSLLMVRRCPICATYLKDKVTCGGCGGDVWGQGFTREDLVRMLDHRMMVCGGLALVLSWVPWIGFFLPIILMNVFVIRILRAYESKWSRAFGNFFVSVVKMIFFLIVFICSTIPFVGLLALVPYFFSYLMRRRRFLK